MKLTIETINNMNVFENITGAKVKDCVNEGSRLLFIVEEASLGKAIGKQGSNIRRVSSIMKKEIQVVAYSDDATKFVYNLIYPNKIDDIKLEEGVLNITTKDNITKGKIFGRGRENLKRIEEIVKRYFKDVKEIRII